MAKIRKHRAHSTVTLPISISERVSVWNTSSMDTLRVSTLERRTGGMALLEQMGPGTVLPEAGAHAVSAPRYKCSAGALVEQKERRRGAHHANAGAMHAQSETCRPVACLHAAAPPTAEQPGSGAYLSGLIARSTRSAFRKRASMLSAMRTSVDITTTPKSTYSGSSRRVVLTKLVQEQGGRDGGWWVRFVAGVSSLRSQIEARFHSRQRTLPLSLVGGPVAA